ncbi:hypothetical protein AXG93_673s1290 [Marchantia polymorpha subsp. ruderalis]|uniref:Uncharacterized protein n=1 Tax=Marchantia polymorpha subsp. ruderalis TaxID=1480154 RepID=A0A176WKV7_MARPO|nr:hypothetical protein AXG93_673s1290 [Marchantia polymorpha subsp. ruderalis]
MAETNPPGLKRALISGIIGQDLARTSQNFCPQRHPASTRSVSSTSTSISMDLHYGDLTELVAGMIVSSDLEAARGEKKAIDQLRTLSQLKRKGIKIVSSTYLAPDDNM